MNEKEKEEFRNLKIIRAERGFWLPEEQSRWNILFDLHSINFKLKCKAIDLIHRQIEQN